MKHYDKVMDFEIGGKDLFSSPCSRLSSSFLVGACVPLEVLAPISHLQLSVATLSMLNSLRLLVWPLNQDWCVDTKVHNKEKWSSIMIVEEEIGDEEEEERRKQKMKGKKKGAKTMREEKRQKEVMEWDHQATKKHNTASLYYWYELHLSLQVVCWQTWNISKSDGRSKGKCMWEGFIFQTNNFCQTNQSSCQ